MRNTTTPASSALRAAVLAIALLGWGCEDTKVISTNTNNGNPSQTDADLGTGHLDDAGHGPDEDVEFIAPGFVNGSWRVGAAEDQSLVVNLDLIQEANATEVEGYFTMSMLAGNGADSQGGDINDTSSFDGETLIIHWNPTPTEGELYTIEATKVDDNTFTGTVSAAIYTDFDKDIRITRYPSPPGTDEGGDGETAGDIDAGSQGGAGG